LAIFKRLKDWFWPLVGLVAVVWAVEMLYRKLKAEAGVDAATKAALAKAGVLESLGIIVSEIGGKLADIPWHGYVMAGLCTLFAYWALAWYDRIALLHLNRTRGISWLYITICSFTTYAISHNIGASVLSGGMVRYRAYTAKGLSAAEVAVLVALCSFTFTYGTILLAGFVLLLEPDLLDNLVEVPHSVPRAIGAGLLGLCALYVVGSWLHFRPLDIRGFHVEYPRLHVVARQLVAAPMEILGAAGIIYFALPEAGNPGYFVVLGAFLLSFSAGLLFQVPGGVGVMEAVFLKVIPGIPAPEVVAALLVWRLFYLLLPLALSIPIVLMFERSKLMEQSRAS
jgi:uncharacterized membrane protein YbhN (UPF0104 family)